MEKSGTGVVGGAITFTEMLVLCISVPFVPVTVMVYEPVAAEVATSMVSMEIADLFGGVMTCDGLRVADTSTIGEDVIVRSTGRLKPFKEVTVMIDTLERPC